jgi:hypothetical protein
MNMVKFALLHGNQENQQWLLIMEVKRLNNIGLKNMVKNNELWMVISLFIKHFIHC